MFHPGRSSLRTGPDRSFGEKKFDFHFDVDRGHAERRRAGLCCGRRALGPAGWPGCVPVHSGNGRGGGVGGPGIGAGTPSPVQVVGYRRHQQDEGLRMLKLLWLVPAIPFVGALVLADNLLLLYLGWEGVGLCSYLLIGFWYQDPVNGLAGRKAFIVTRVGDTAMAIGLFLLFHSLGTLRIQDLLHTAQVQWSTGSAYAIAAAALLLGGAVGKSAQLPLQTWLPDAMAGPTPTSALIHAATMVTAGVYLIARTHVLFELAPPVQFAVAAIGAATLLTAGFSALVQNDIKRVLAYSTVSQVGYMFLALGVGAWGAAIFHFMTHAFFKALLFLAAGIIIEALHHEHDIFRMGGLRKELPVAFWTFLVAGCSLAGLPLITAGYYRKDLILWSAGSSATGSTGLWAAGIAGVVLTSLYTFRLIFLVFFGPVRTPVTKQPGLAMTIPVCVLAVLSIVGGFDRVPFARFIATALPTLPEAAARITETLSSVVAALAFLCGLLGAWFVYQRNPGLATAMVETPAGRLLHRFWFSDWGMDWLYDRLFVHRGRS